MKNIFNGLLIVLVAVSEATESNSLPLDIETKTLQPLNDQTNYHISHFVSIRHKSQGTHFCGGYLVIENMVASRAYCCYGMIDGVLRVTIEDTYAIVKKDNIFEPRKILSATHLDSYRPGDPRSPGDFALFKLKSYIKNPLVSTVTLIRDEEILLDQILTMVVMTHQSVVKQFDVHYTNIEDCNIDSRHSDQQFKDQMCVRLPMEKYFEIQGTASEAGSSSCDNRFIKEFVSGSPIYLNTKLVGFVSDFHVRNKDILYVHCTNPAKYAWILKDANHVPQNASYYWKILKVREKKQ